MADLWSATGNLLATATFTNETASGWQQVNLATPVVVTAGTTYVVSYHTNGILLGMMRIISPRPITNGSLTALASGTSGGNGVYAYGSGISSRPTASLPATTGWMSSLMGLLCSRRSSCRRLSPETMILGRPRRPSLQRRNQPQARPWQCYSTRAQLSARTLKDAADAAIKSAIYILNRRSCWDALPAR